MVRTGPVHAIRGAEPLPAIKIGAVEAKPSVASAAMLLVIFMRVVAMLWIVEGVAQWGAVLMDPSGDVLASVTPQRVAAIVFFCLLDLIAGVGLWLTAPWGGVVWLITVGGQMLSLVLLPGFWTHPFLTAILDAGLAIAYVALAWLAAREVDAAR